MAFAKIFLHLFEKIDIPLQMRYNRVMEKINTAIIGGGAAGLFLANLLKNQATVFERGERLGRKLSATGNGQGNISNLAAAKEEYFSQSGGKDLASALVQRYDGSSLTAFFKERGVLCAADERGRIYPTSRQASALTDALRFGVESRGVDVRLQTQVVGVKKEKEGFVLTLQKGEARAQALAQRVVLCTGGKAAKNFGTDGSAYALAQSLGHTLTPLYPSLVQLKTDVKPIKTLKGIRINGGVLRVVTPKRTLVEGGDIIFTDYGVSGDAVFRASAFIADEISSGKCRLELDFLPSVTEGEILQAMGAKRRAFPTLPVEEMLFGIVNNQVGRAIFRLAAGDMQTAAKLVKAFPLTVTGSLGFDYAQVTKGGVPVSEVTENLESRLVKGLYLVGEILDVDGQCGGFNLQWAYSSACAVANSITE